MSFFQLEEMCWSGRGGLTGFDFDGMFCRETTLWTCAAATRQNQAKSKLLLGDESQRSTGPTAGGCGSCGA